MKKIITTLTAMTFALGLAAAAPAQTAKTPEKPATPSVTQPQVAPQEAAKPGETAAKEMGKAGDPTKEAVKPGDEKKIKHTAQKEAKKAVKKGKAERKGGAHMETPPAATK